MRFFFLLFLISCDFTSGLHKEIIEAQKNISEQKYGKASEIYEKILDKNSSDLVKIKINFQLGKLKALHLNKPEESIVNFKEILNSTEDPIWQIKAQEEIAEIYFSQLKKYNDSLKVYKSLASFRPKLEKHDFYIYRTGLCKLNQKKYDKALEVFLSIGRESNYYKRSLYHQGLIHFERSKHQYAINTWWEYLKRETRKDFIVQTKFLIANSHERLENLKEAYEIYYSILGEYPNSDVIKNRLKSLYQRRIARKR